MKVLVIGDSCKDKFIYGKCERICPEATVPVFNPVNQVTNGGMTKNVFSNLKSLAPKWTIDLITNDQQISKTRLVDIKTNQMLVRIDENDTCARVPNVTSLGHYDAVVISDYNKGFLHKKDIEILLDKYPLSFIDSKKIFGDYIKKASFIKISPRSASFFAKVSSLLSSSLKKRIFSNNKTSPGFNLLEASIALESILSR